MLWEEGAMDSKDVHHFPNATLCPRTQLQLRRHLILLFSGPGIPGSVGERWQGERPDAAAMGAHPR